MPRMPGIRGCAAFLLGYFVATGSLTLRGEEWTAVGETQLVEVGSDGQISLSATEPGSAGAVSEALRCPRQANAILVEAEVSDVEAYSLTLAANEAAGGDTIGYWQNPLPIGERTTIHAVLPLHAKTKQYRLFVGTHLQRSGAKVHNVAWRPVRRGMSHRFSLYGVLISGDETLRQTFRSTGKSVEAVTLLVRRMSEESSGPDLRVRLFQWKDALGDSLSGKPLAETVVPRAQIPGSKSMGGEEMVATYGGEAIELTVPLKARTKRGKFYLVELSTTGPASSKEGFLTYAWLDGYRHGELFRNTAAKGWDLWMEVYHAP